MFDTCNLSKRKISILDDLLKQLAAVSIVPEKNKTVVIFEIATHG